MFQIGLQKFLLLQKLEILCCGHMLLGILQAGKIVGTFWQKELQKANQKEFRVEKVIKRKDNKLYLKWKDCKGSFNSNSLERVAQWLATCTRKPKFPRLNPADSYVQR